MLKFRYRAHQVYCVHSQNSQNPLSTEGAGFISAVQLFCPRCCITCRATSCTCLYTGIYFGYLSRASISLICILYITPTDCTSVGGDTKSMTRIANFEVKTNRLDRLTSQGNHCHQRSEPSHKACPAYNISPLLDLFPHVSRQWSVTSTPAKV